VLLFKAMMGALIVVIISYLAKSKNYYIVGLVPLFPTFALIGHIIIGTERGVGELKETIVFGMWSLIPYFVYLLILYLIVDRVELGYALLMGLIGWATTALILVVIWNRGTGG